MSKSRNSCDSPFEEVDAPDPGYEAYDMQHSYHQQNTEQPGIIERGLSRVRGCVESKQAKIDRLEREVEYLNFEMGKRNDYIKRLQDENSCFREAYNETIANVRSLNDEVDRLKNECQQYKTDSEKLKERCHQKETEDECQQYKTDLENLKERCHKKEKEVERLLKDIKENKEKMVQSEKKWKLRLADADSKSRELMDKVMKSVQDNRELQYKLISYKTIEEEKERMTASRNAESKKSNQLQQENYTLQAKIMDVECEIRRLTNEMNMMDSVNKKNRLENEQLRAELSSERERAVNMHDQTIKQCGDLMLKKDSEFERGDVMLKKDSEFEQRIENMKKDFNKRIEELNRRIMKHDDKRRPEKDHSAEKEALCTDNAGVN